ncbi:MAG: DUF711 family protein [Acidipila sp.]|nr:DUF711 family protein [Acidipila sp.]
MSTLPITSPIGAQPKTAAKPKVRALTAFVKVDREHFAQQIADTLKMLRAAKAAIEQGGYEVQTIRITTQPFPEYIRGLSREQAVEFFRDYDALAVKENFNANIGPAMLRDADDPSQAELLGVVLAGAKALNASLLIAGEDGIHWNGVRAAARLIKYLEEHSPRSQGNFNFGAAALVEPYGPFFPASYHTGEGHQFAIGLESANVVDDVFAATAHQPALALASLTRELDVHNRAVEAIALRVEKETGWTYLGIDPTPAPLKDVSIAAAMEKFTGARFGSSGTLTAAAIITQAVKSVHVKRIGYSGLMLPVLEDSIIAQRWSEGSLTIDSLLAYSAVCATGLDTVPLPGDVSVEQLEKILGDLASLAVKWHKPLTARLLPVVGKKAGQRTEFESPFLTNATIQPLP